MKVTELLTENRYCSNHFNKDEYPKLIDRITEQLGTYFDELMTASDGGNKDAILSDGVDAILNEIEAQMDRQRFKFRKKSVFADDHIVLSLFVVPAAAKMGTPIARKFAELMSSKFTERFPGTTFKVGDYDDIMEGFKWKLTLFSKE